MELSVKGRDIRLLAPRYISFVLSSRGEREMGATHPQESREVTVTLSVVVEVSPNSDGLVLADFFDHEINDALTPDAALLDELLVNAGLPLKVIRTCPQ
jgi:hypothetical protein